MVLAETLGAGLFAIAEALEGSRTSWGRAEAGGLHLGRRAKRGCPEPRSAAVLVQLLHSQQEPGDTGETRDERHHRGERGAGLARPVEH